MDAVSILIIGGIILLIGLCAWMGIRLAGAKTRAHNRQVRLEALEREVDDLRSGKSSVDRDHALARLELEQLRAEVAIASSAMAARDKELDDTRERAREAGRTKSLFMANMSHELRTPLNGILGLTRNLLDSKLTPRQRSELELIQIAGDDLVRIVNDVLDLSKLENGKLTLEKVPFDFCDLIEGAYSLLYPQAERKQLTYGVTYSHLMPRRFVGDPFRLRQVTLNLVSNAIKFTQSGSVFLHVVEGERRGGTVWVRISVEDTGIGIEDAKRRLIFDEFQQADPSTTRKYGGTGLGLSLSKRIVDLMGGELEVESEFGNGSCFSLHVPLSPVSPATTPLETGANPLDEIRILVQDRHSVQTRVLLRVLEALPGVEVEMFEAPEDALQRISNAEFGRSFDAIVSSADSTSFSVPVAQKILSQVGPSAPLHLLLAENTGIGNNQVRSTGKAVVIPAPILPSRVIAALQQLRKIPVGPLFESAGLTAYDVYRDSQRPADNVLPTVVAHENPVQLRLLEGMLQKLNVPFVSACTESDLLPLLENHEYHSVVLHGHLLHGKVRSALAPAEPVSGAELRLFVVGETDDTEVNGIAERARVFMRFNGTPRLSQLRDFLRS